MSSPVGYTFDAELYCPECVPTAVILAVADDPAFDFDAVNGVTNVDMPAEWNLDRMAEVMYVDRTTEDEYDSSVFPKVYAGTPHDTCDHTGCQDVCGSCSELIGEDSGTCPNSMRIDESEALELYDASLDEMGDVSIGSLSYSASLVLKEVDPITYRVGFSDWSSEEGYDVC